MILASNRRESRILRCAHFLETAELLGIILLEDPPAQLFRSIEVQSAWTYIICDGKFQLDFIRDQV